MTTATWSSGSLCTTDAEFRSLGSEFSVELAAVGLVQTADTGQINWSTVLRAAANVNAGYEIWRFNDAMQATAPIFLKVWYGTGGGTPAGMRLQVEIGTASNGTGTVTGTGSGVAQMGNQSQNGTATAVPSNSYMCHTSGFLGWYIKVGNACQGFLVLCRTCDSSGTPDADGIFSWSFGGTASGNNNNCRMIRYASPAAVQFSAVLGPGNTIFCLMPGSLASTTLPSGDKQVYLCWTANPDMRPLFAIGSVLTAEFAALTTFTTSLVGSTPRTFLATQWVGQGYQAGGAAAGIAMLWE